MRRISLEEFKKRTKKGVSIYNNPDNQYKWKIYEFLKGIEHSEDIINTPIFELTRKTLDKHYKVSNVLCHATSNVCFGRFLFIAAATKISPINIVITLA